MVKYPIENGAFFWFKSLLKCIIGDGVLSLEVTVVSTIEALLFFYSF